MSTAVTYPTSRLRQRAAAFGLLANMLGADVRALLDDDLVAGLRRILDDAGDTGALQRLDGLESVRPRDPSDLAGTWVRWFDLGRVAAYEGSNVPATAGGVTPRLADIAGFYSAFGMAVSKDRPDHIVAELEFMTVLLLAEAEAREAGDRERAEIAADAARVFLRDHLGTWVTAWAARVGDVDELRPWFPVAAATAELVRAECRDRRVIPLRLSPVLPADGGLADPDEPAPRCGD